MITEHRALTMKSLLKQECYRLQKVIDDRDKTIEELQRKLDPVTAAMNDHMKAAMQNLQTSLYGDGSKLPDSGGPMQEIPPLPEGVTSGVAISMRTPAEVHWDQLRKESEEARAAQTRIRKLSNRARAKKAWAKIRRKK